MEAKYSLYSLQNRGVDIHRILPGFGEGNPIRPRGLYELRDIDNLTIAFYLKMKGRNGKIVEFKRLPNDLFDPQVMYFWDQAVCEGVVMPIVDGMDLVGSERLKTNGYVIRDVTEQLCRRHNSQSIGQLVGCPEKRESIGRDLMDTSYLIITQESQLARSNSLVLA